MTPRHEHAGLEASIPREGCPIEIRPASLPETLGIAPGDRVGDAVVASGISPGRVWTTPELKELWKVPSLTRKDVELLTRIKALFDGEIMSVEPLTEKGGSDRGEK